MLTTFTHYQTKLAVIPFLFLGIGLLLFLSSALHRSLWNEVVTPLRLTVVAAASALAGALAWLATGTLLMGLLSGFSVCAKAPIWLSLARVRGLDTATRRWFTNLAAAWFGTALATPHEPG
ncbi:hypothetical protein [Nocardia sp. NPDC051981]|uniref:hypothetical protein n=1 Tax=Nocardia sp. NPDC051981 TaxID=3155417 RepID=UPI003432797F